MLVERCWFCLEQPAVTTVTMDAKDYPACDICAAEQAGRAPSATEEAVSDEEWARIVQDLS